MSIRYTGGVFRSITQTKHFTKPHTLDPAGRRAVRVSTVKFVYGKKVLLILLITKVFVKEMHLTYMYM